MGPRTEIAVCVITYKRPEGLARLLRSLGCQELGPDHPTVRLIVVDNDASESARAVFEAARAVFEAARTHHPWAMEYHVEKRRGIPFARNRCVAEASSTADSVVFIDDDEEAAANWLATLLEAQRLYDADVVAGPVLPRFEARVPVWIRKRGLFEHLRYASGERIDVTGSGNVLVRSGVFRGLQKHFDESFGFQGGSDTDFFRRVHQAKFKMVWADQAIVYEWIPASRATTAWMLKRFFSNGTANSRAEMSRWSGLLQRPVVIGKGLGFAVVGFLLLPVGLLQGRAACVKYLRYVCYGAGLIAGSCGRRQEQYRTIHGS